MHISNKGSDMQEFHNNHIQDCLLSTIISTSFDLETRGWSQIQAEENIFSDLTYYTTINILEVKIYCT